MTNDERISAYIDNEFSGEQEQEFLISLAASDTLRKSFRSELVLKNIVHRDESLTTPPRELRAAVFAAVGLATATAVTATKSNAAEPATHTSHGVLKTFFATKVHTLVTAATVSLSALAGYGVHEIVTPHTNAAPAIHAEAPLSHSPAVQTEPASQPLLTDRINPTNQTNRSVVVKHHPAHHVKSVAVESVTKATDANPSGVAGGGDVTIKKPVINKTK